MIYRALGNTGLQVSEIGLGCEGFTEQEGMGTYALVDAAAEAGINYFDLYSPDPNLRLHLGDVYKRQITSVRSIPTGRLLSIA